jgi:hypothetical protein
MHVPVRGTSPLPAHKSLRHLTVECLHRAADKLQSPPPLPRHPHMRTPPCSHLPNPPPAPPPAANANATPPLVPPRSVLVWSSGESWPRHTHPPTPPARAPARTRGPPTAADPNNQQRLAPPRRLLLSQREKIMCEPRCHANAGLSDTPPWPCPPLSAPVHSRLSPMPLAPWPRRLHMPFSHPNPSRPFRALRHRPVYHRLPSTPGLLRISCSRHFPPHQASISSALHGCTPHHAPLNIYLHTTSSPACPLPHACHPTSSFFPITLCQFHHPSPT